MAWTRDAMAARGAQELEHGSYVNLGIGLPTLVANHLPDGVRVIVQSENGTLGTGPAASCVEEDPDVINAGGQTVLELPGASYFDSAASFAMIRGGHIAVSVLGGMQVSESGDLANWAAPGGGLRGMGGAMDLVEGVGRVIVLMEHNDRSGRSKLVSRCTYPLTGAGVVDLVITELGVFEVDPGKPGLVLVETAPGVQIDEVRARTEAGFEVQLRSGSRGMREGP